MHSKVNGSQPGSVSCAKVTFNTSGIKFPSSTTLTGSRYVTEHTALSDQHLVTGKCEVQYWMTADILSETATDITIHPNNSTIHPLMISPSLASVGISPSSSMAKQHSRLRFKQSRNSFFAYFGCSTTLPRQWPTICFSTDISSSIRLRERGPNGQYYFSLPIVISITTLQSTSGADATRSTILQHYLRQKGLEGVVYLTGAQWRTAQRFSAGAGAVATDHTITNVNSRAIVQDTKLDFPPFYVLKTKHGEEYTATTYVDITVPHALLSSPSFGSDLLSVSHNLDLVLSTRKLDTSMTLLPSCTAKMQIDCALT